MSGNFNIYSLVFLITALPVFFVPFFVFMKNRNSAVNRTFFILAASATLYQIGYFFAFNSDDSASTAWFCRLTYVGVSFLTPATLDFVLALLNLKRRRLIILSYAFAVISSLLVLGTDQIISGFNRFSWGNCPKAGPMHDLFLLIWIIPFFVSLCYLRRGYKLEPSSYNKMRIGYYSVSLPLAYLAVVDYLPNHGIDLFPFGFLPLLFFCLSTTYGILRYRLLDIGAIMKKASLIALGVAVSAGIMYLGTFYLQHYFYKLGGKNWVVFPILISFLVGFALFRFIELVRDIEVSDLSKRLSYRPFLEKEALRMVMSNNLNELLAFVARDLTSWVGLDYVGIFVLDETSNRFVLNRSFSRSKNIKKPPAGAVLNQDSPLVLELLRRRTPLVYSEIDYYLKVRAGAMKERDFLTELLSQMQKLCAEVSVPAYCEGRLVAIVNLGRKTGAGEVITVDELRILHSLASQFGRTVYDFMLKREKIRLIVASQNALISAIEAKDSYTKGHTERVARYAIMIGKNLSLISKAFSYELNNLEWCAQLHDVGKIGIPDNILLKPGPLTDPEWAQIKEHTLEGVKIITAVREWLGEDICAGILQHHENYDGSGYPFQTKAEGIHIFSRIIRVVDSFDAMTTDRPYRAALSKKDAIDELKRFKGVFYDPVIVDICEYLHKKGEI